MIDNARLEARRKAGFPTQADLAKRLGIGKSTVANWESGYTRAKPWYDLLLQTLIENRRLKGEIDD